MLLLVKADVFKLAFFFLASAGFYASGAAPLDLLRLRDFFLDNFRSFPSWTPGISKFWALGSVAKLAVCEPASYSSFMASSIHFLSSDTCWPTLTCV